MNVDDNITPLMPSIVALHKLFTIFNNKAIIIGGVAASLLGKPRLTADVDAVLNLSIEEIPSLIDIAKQEGLFPRIKNAEDFARQHRVLLLRHDESGINVDISLALLPFEIEAIERSIAHQAGKIEIRLPTPEDLIIFKAVAHREKDLLDIQEIIKSQPKLDREHIIHWVKEFAEVLEMPEIWDDIAKWLY